MERKKIEDLPDEVLLEIFSYLPTSDIKYNISKVCVRWSNISADTDLWKHLFFETISSSYEVCYSAWHLTLRFLQSTPHLQNIIISQGHSIVEVIQILDLINDNCPNIRQIEFHLDIAPIMKRLQNCKTIMKNLENLSFKLFSPSSQMELFSSLSEFKALKKVSFIESCPQHREFNVFLDSCPLLEHLNITCDEFCKTNFMSLLNKKDKFVSLSLNIDNLDEECIKHLATFSSLNCLKLMDSNTSPEKLHQVGKLRNVKSLYLCENAKSSVLTSSALVDFFHEGYFERLHELKLHKSRLDDRGAKEIRRKCVNIVYLEVMTYPRSHRQLTETALLHLLHCRMLESLEIIFDNAATDWIYRRSRYFRHDCDIDGDCALGLDAILCSWDEVQIPVD